METLETEKFFSDDKALLKPISDHSTVVSIVLQPFKWLQMLCSRLKLTSVLGVVLVYGVNQGFSGSIFKVVTDYYWKDVQQVQPSVVQLYMGIYYMPWVMRPIGVSLPMFFLSKVTKESLIFVVAGILGFVSTNALVVFGKLPAALALSCLLGVSAAMAIADVVIDECIATNSITIRSLAPDIQSLCMICSSAGALIGYATSGVFVHRLGPQVESVHFFYPVSGGSIRGISIFACNSCHTWFFIYEKRASAVPVQKNKKDTDDFLELSKEPSFPSSCALIVLDSLLLNWVEGLFFTLLVSPDTTLGISGL